MINTPVSDIAYVFTERERRARQKRAKAMEGRFLQVRDVAFKVVVKRPTAKALRSVRDEYIEWVSSKEQQVGVNVVGVCATGGHN